jgi:hypothetical protein
VLLDDVGDQADLAVPGLVRVGLGQCRHEREVRKLLREGVELLLEAQVLLRPGAVVVRRLARAVLLGERPQHREDRRHPGAAPDEDDVRVAAVAQREDTERSHQVELVTDRDLGVQEMGELPVGVAPDHELELATLLARGVGHREGAGLLAARDLDVDVLTGPEGDLGRFGQLHDEVPHVVGDVLVGDHLGLDLLDGVAGPQHLLVVVEELDGDVLVDVRPAEEREPLVELEVGEREGRVLVELDVVTVEDERLAGGALAFLAAVHERDALLGGGAQHRLLLVDLDLDANRLESHDMLLAHISLSVGGFR